MEYSIDLELICDVLHKLAVKHREYFERSGEREELDRSIFHDRIALGLRPEGHLDRCETSNNLGISLYMRFAQWGKLEDLEEAISLHRVALNHWPQGHPDRSSSLNNLAAFLITRFERYGRSSDLDEAIELHRATLELRPEGHPNRSSSLGNLATSLQSRFNQHGRLEDLDKAIEFHRAALELCPEDHNRSKLLNNLAGSLTTRFEKCGQMDDLDEAIDLYRSVLKLRPEGHPLRSLSLNNLAASFQYRFRQCGRMGDLDKAIKLQRAALKICPEDHPDRSASLNNLAISLQTRFEQYGRIEDLDKAVELYRSALQLCPAGHHLHSSALDNLACSLQSRFLQHRQMEDLNEAIKLHRIGLKFRPEGHPDRSTSLNNLANSLKTQFGQFRRVEDLNEAIELHCDALEHLTEGHPDRPASLSNIAASLTTRYEHHRRKDDLDKSTKLHRASLELCSTDHPLRSVLLNNYASSLQAQFSQHGRTEDLGEAIELHRAALGLRPEGHPDRSKSLTNLGFSLYSRSQKLGALDDFEEAMRLLKHASEHTFSSSVMRLESASLWANLARTHAHRTTSSAYKVAMMLLQRVLIVSPTLPAQLDFLKRNSYYKALSSDAAAYAIEENRLEEAIEILEQGRCLLWSQMRGFRTSIDQLMEVDRELADRFKNVSRRLEALATSSEGLASGPRMNGGKSLASDIRTEQSFDEVLRLKKQLIKEQEEIINEIRRIPAFESFLASTPLKVLQRAASEGPVIVVNHSKYRSDTLIMLSCEDVPVICVPLDGKFYRDSVELCITLSEMRRRFTADSYEYDEKLIEVMKALWDRVVSKVVDKLEELGIVEGSRVWWCPTSILSALPFHAAGPFQDLDGTEKYLLDKYVSSYTPTLEALISARLGGTGGEPTVFVIGDMSLPSAKGEIRNIRNCGINTKLLLKNTSRDAVIKALRRATWVHFVCHGALDPEPFNSSFKVSDCGLTLLDIIQANLPNAEFAFLSACHTAEQPHDSVHDEVVHLAAAMQFSGFRSVIGSMWELLDEDGPYFAKAIYQYIWECVEGEARYKRAAAGLRKAAVELKARDSIRTERWVNLVHIGA